MKSISIFFVLLGTLSVQAQIRYLEEIFTDDELVQTEFIYSNGPTEHFDNIEVNAYTFRNPDDDDIIKPVVIVIAGNGFPIEALAGNARSFARMGYLPIVCNFRSTLDTLPTVKSEAYYARETYRGVQDLNALYRYIAENVIELKANKNLIFISAASIGAATAMHSVTTGLTDEYGLGPIDSFGVATTKSYKVRAVQCYKGAVLTEVTDWIPMQFIHGSCDETVPIDEGHLKSEPELNYLYGPLTIIPQLIAEDVKFEAFFTCGGNHFTALFPDGEIEKLGAEFFVRIMRNRTLRGIEIIELLDEDCGLPFCD
jgi:hypothetical protein